MIRRIVDYYLPEFERDTGVLKKEYDDIEFFVDLLAATEITARLVAEDYECTLEEAFHLSWISQPFGEREYHYDKPCVPLKRLYRDLSKDFIQELRQEAGEVVESEEDDEDETPFQAALRFVMQITTPSHTRTYLKV